MKPADGPIDMGEPELSAMKPADAREWRLTIPGQPQPHERAIPQRRGRGVALVTPHRTRAYEAAVAMIGRMHLPREKLRGPLGVEIVALYPRLVREPKDAPDEAYHGAIGRDDCDNLAKPILDGLRAHFNDCHVTRLAVEKGYVERGGQPRVEVAVWRIDL